MECVSVGYLLASRSLPEPAVTRVPVVVVVEHAVEMGSLRSYLSRTLRQRGF